jgi:predicted  nucleic acid-binding Zn-ribbon protein
MAVHFHKCPNCGKVWRHSPANNWTQKQIDRSHNCPHCGKRTYTYAPKSDEDNTLPLMEPEEHPMKE